MNARRAILHHVVMGTLFVAGGIVSLVVMSSRVDYEFNVFVGLLAATFVAATVFIVATSARGLHRAEPLPRAARRLPWYSVTARVALSVAVPVAVLLYGATSPSDAGWVLPFGCVLLGAAVIGIAGLVARAERRYGAPVFQMGNRYFLVVDGG